MSDKHFWDNERAPTPHGDNWRTPRWLFEEVQDMLGVTFSTDPCAADGNPLGTHFHYTARDNGLDPANLWYGDVFLNPPFSDIEPWVERAAKQHNGRTVAALVPARTDQQWWERWVVPRASSLIFFRNRIRFEAPDGSTPIGRPRERHVVVVYGPCRLPPFASIDATYRNLAAKG